MIITNYGHFTRATGDSPYIMFFKNEEGQDWYEMQRGETDGVPKLVELGDQGVFISSIHPVWCMVNPQGVVTNVEFDPSRMVPDDKTILGFDEATLDDVKEGMLYHNGELLPAPEPEPAPYSLSKEIPWLRMTDAEAEDADQAFNSASVRFRQAYNSAASLTSGTDLWNQWRNILLSVFTEERVDELLAPET